jgi:hemerythrin superfamily protein
MDAISLLKKDHRTVKSLFARFDKLGDGAVAQKKAIVKEIVRELSIHAAIEEALFYPTARAAVKAKEDLVLEALEEHHVVKWLLEELSSIEPTHERFDAKVTVLKEAVNHHVEEEETDLFPAFERKVTTEERKALGTALEAAKKLAPTRPHPKAPDTPPGNLLASIPSALLDKVRDLVSSNAQAPMARGQRTLRRLGASPAMHRMGRASKKAAASKKKASRKAR